MSSIDPGDITSLTALKNEINNDPRALGYAGKTSAQQAAILNAQSGDTLSINALLDAYQVINATDPTEWAALSAQEKQRFQTITGAGQVDVSNANVRGQFQAMFGAGTATRAALLALTNRQVTRAEKLFGVGMIIAYYDVDRAKAV